MEIDYCFVDSIDNDVLAIEPSLRVRIKGRVFTVMI